MSVGGALVNRLAGVEVLADLDSGSPDFREQVYQGLGRRYPG